MEDPAQAFLLDVLNHRSASPCPATQPYVTLSFAQSLDAKIAGAHGRQLILSGKESMIMTHWLRTMHDAILVGIGTALNDDPQLNVRYLPHPPETPYNLPRPIILDTDLRLSPTCKLLQNYQNGKGRRPWVICAASGDATPKPKGTSASTTTAETTSTGHHHHPSEDIDKLLRKRSLEEAGARIIQVPTSQRRNVQGHADGIASRHLSIPEILTVLRDLGVRSLMVEGGAQIIRSFLAEPVVDVVIITVAPVLVGKDGTGYESPVVSLPADGASHSQRRFVQKATRVFGKDAVVVLEAVTGGQSI